MIRMYGMIVIETLSKWLTGTWTYTDGNRRVGLYIAEAPGRLLGSEVFMDLEKGGIRHHEIFEIREKDGRVELEVFPQDQPCLVMALTAFDGNTIRFENPEHDFPKWWSFSLDEEGNLHENAGGDTLTLHHGFTRSGGG